MARIYDDVTQLVGNTPLVRLNRITEGPARPSWPSSSSTTRPAASRTASASSMIDAAEQSGELKPGGTIVEATSGNTGIALAMVGAARGYKRRPHHARDDEQGAPGAAARLRCRARAHPGGRGHEGLRSTRPRRSVARRAPSSPASSRTRPTRRSTAGRRPRRSGTTPTAQSTSLVAGIGTGGTITGVGQVLKAAQAGREDLRRRARRVARSSTAAQPGPPQDPGHRRELRPRDPRPHDLRRGHRRRRRDPSPGPPRRASEEGLLVGISSGAALRAAIQVAKRPEYAGKLIVVIVPSFGERYLSTILFSGPARLRAFRSAPVTAGWRARLREDLDAAVARDPAVRSRARGRPRLPGAARHLGVPARTTAVAARSPARRPPRLAGRPCGRPASRSTPAPPSAAGSSSTTAWAW